jgi:hypothetical protein
LYLKSDDAGPDAPFPPFEAPLAAGFLVGGGALELGASGFLAYVLVRTIRKSWIWCIP